MTSRDTRLDRLSTSLTARERAVLVLRSWKDGKEEEPSWRWTMPDEEAPEFNRYIELMNGVNVRLLPLVVVIGLEVDKLGLRLGILATLALWNMQALHVDEFIRFGAKRRSVAVALLEDSLVHTPLRPVVYISEELQAAVERACAAPTKIDEVVATHKDVLRDGIAEQSAWLRAVEIVVGEVAEQFDGEDPALPHTRVWPSDWRSRSPERRRAPRASG